MFRARILILFACTAIASAAVLLQKGPQTKALQNDMVPPELADVQIDEKPGAPLPKDLQFVDHLGHVVRLRDLIDPKKPTLMVMAYYSCPMLCTVVLNGLVDGMKGLPSSAGLAGEGFRVITVSIDKRDTAELAAKKRLNYLAAYGRPDADWQFLTDPTGLQSKALADSLGFRYHWDPKGEQFAHAAGAFILTPDGRLSRVLYGISFPSETLRLALIEASDGKLGTAWDKIRLFCYHYDPNARGYVASAWRIMRLGGVLTLCAMSLLLAFMWRRKPTAVVQG